MNQEGDLYKKCKMNQKRQVAYKVKIKDILDGVYVKEEGEWTPNYIEINEKKISRANIIGTVVLKQDDENLNYQNLTLDDGSGKISIRSFDKDNFFKDVDIGDVVLLIGRPRQFASEKYVVPEILRKIENKKWIDVRKLELKKEKKNVTEVKEEEIKTVNIENVEESPNSRIIQLIKKLDIGGGADADKIISKSNVKEADSIIKNLLEEGEIFEIKPGKYKVLE